MKPARVCSEEGCGRTHFGRGYCYRHYTRHRNGRPMGGGILLRLDEAKDSEKPAIIAEHILSRCEPQPNGCLLWTGAKNNHGYGRINIDRAGRVRYVHRIMAEIYSGESAEGRVVMHSCDTPLCVAKDHLSFGTQADNIRDMARKGRTGSAKLTVEQVVYLRGNEGDRSRGWRRRLASEWGVSTGSLRAAEVGESYAWIGGRS